MPVTRWHEIAGEKCNQCGKWATHWYGLTALCCECHGGHICTQEQAEVAHTQEAIDIVRSQILDVLSQEGRETMWEPIYVDDQATIAAFIAEELASVIDVEKVFEQCRKEGYPDKSEQRDFSLPIGGNQ